LVTLGTFVIAEQLIAKWAYHREIQKLIAANQPVDFMMLRESFFSSTSQAQTVQRVEVEQAFGNADGFEQYIEIWPTADGNSSPLHQSLVPHGVSWPERVLYEHYVDEQHAVLAELARLAESAEPTWRFRTRTGQYFPLSLPGWRPWETYLLDAQVVLAYHDNDSARTIRALETLQSTITTRDWETTITEDVGRILSDHGKTVRIIQSLESSSFWTEEQLDRLEQLLVPREALAERWRKVLSGERAMSLGAIDANTGWMMGTVDGLPHLTTRLTAARRTIPATSLLRFVRTLNELLPLADQGYTGLTGRATSAANWRTPDMVGWIPFHPLDASRPRDVEALRALTPATGFYANYLVDLEDTRRLAQIAIGLRRYANSKGHWPEQLSQLQEFGVRVDELRTIDGAEFSMQRIEGSMLRIDVELKILDSPQARMDI